MTAHIAHTAQHTHTHIAAHTAQHTQHSTHTAHHTQHITHSTARTHTSQHTQQKREGGGGVCQNRRYLRQRTTAPCRRRRTHTCGASGNAPPPPRPPTPRRWAPRHRDTLDHPCAVPNSQCLLRQETSTTFSGISSGPGPPRDPGDLRTWVFHMWCLPPHGVQVESVSFHMLRFEDVRPGTLWIAGVWDPCNEVSPLAEDAPYPVG